MYWRSLTDSLGLVGGFVIYNIICYLSPVPGVGISEPYDFDGEVRPSGEKGGDSTGTASLSDVKGSKAETKEGV